MHNMTGADQTTPIIPCIVGPTASGKSTLSRQLADQTGGRIISVDSRKIYRHLNIGTAKPAPDLLKKYDYAMINIIEPTELFSAHDYATRAKAVLDETLQRGQLPILAGGTGLYLRALKEGLLTGPGPDEQARSEIYRRADNVGWDELFNELERIDPQSAKKIDRANIHRLVRALEVYYLTGEPISVWQERGEHDLPPWRYLLFGIDRTRSELHDRISRRTKIMVEQGLFEEVEQLLRAGIDPNAPGFNSVGYHEVLAWKDGSFTRDECVERITISTRQYAKRQSTWFRNQEDVTWLPPTDDALQAIIKSLNVH